MKEKGQERPVRAKVKVRPRFLKNCRRSALPPSGDIVEGHCYLRSVRMAPRKLRYVADMVRNVPVEDALNQLKLSPLKGADYLYRAAQSAVSNLEFQHNVDRAYAWLRIVSVDEGRTLKRGKPRSKGMRVPIMKRTSHIYVRVEGSKR